MRRAVGHVREVVGIGVRCVRVRMGGEGDDARGVASEDGARFGGRGERGVDDGGDAEAAVEGAKGGEPAELWIW